MGPLYVRAQKLAALTHHRDWLGFSRQGPVIMPHWGDWQAPSLGQVRLRNTGYLLDSSELSGNEAASFGVTDEFDNVSSNFAICYRCPFIVVCKSCSLLHNLDLRGDESSRRTLRLRSRTPELSSEVVRLSNNL